MSVIFTQIQCYGGKVIFNLVETNHSGHGNLWLITKFMQKLMIDNVFCFVFYEVMRLYTLRYKHQDIKMISYAGFSVLLITSYHLNGPFAQFDHY